MKARQITILASALLLSVAAHAAPFGGPDDKAFAIKLWDNMGQQNLVGENAIMSTPYTGAHPHGAILDTIDATTQVADEKGVLIIKRNYGGEGVNKQTVANDPDKYLKAITVMFQRQGYDPENKDWFWVKYTPAGKIMKNPAGVSLAGKIGKGDTKGCIACHKASPGGDLVFNHDRYK